MWNISGIYKSIFLIFNPETSIFWKKQFKVYIGRGIREKRKGDAASKSSIQILWMAMIAGWQDAIMTFIVHLPINKSAIRMSEKLLIWISNCKDTWYKLYKMWKQHDVALRSVSDWHGYLQSLFILNIHIACNRIFFGQASSDIELWWFVKQLSGR